MSMGRKNMKHDKKKGNRKPQIFDDFWLPGDLTPAALLRLPVISPTASTVSRCPVREIQNSGQALAKLKTVGCSSMGHIPHDNSNREIYDEPSNFRGPFSKPPNIYIYIDRFVSTLESWSKGNLDDAGLL